MHGNFAGMGVGYKSLYTPDPFIYEGKKIENNSTKL